jgi:hypothetical protein
MEHRKERRLCEDSGRRDFVLPERPAVHTGKPDRDRGSSDEEQR